MIQIGSVILATILSLANIDKEQIRKDYTKAVENKTICKEWISELEKTQSSDATLLAYQGAFLTFWANHTSNPFEKLSTFKKGKEKIERAVKLDPQQVEIRFIRYSIQKKAPSFLNYRSNLEDDRQYLITYKDKVESTQLKNLINKILTE